MKMLNNLSHQALTIMVVCLFFITTIKFLAKPTNILVLLILLEIMVLLCYFWILMVSHMNIETFKALVMLTIAVADGVLGLSLMLALVRSMGQPYINSKASLLW